MTACELLENYDPAVRPFGTVPDLEKSINLFMLTKYIIYFRWSRDSFNKFDNS
jgi:hypothetical protein